MAVAQVFPYRVRPLQQPEIAPMLETSLNQLEQLVTDLMHKNAQLAQELAQAKEENETLQLSLMEQEEKHGATAARIQALVDRASAGVVGA
jgi:FtsZ-binding cell division protein ZapB